MEPSIQPDVENLQINNEAPTPNTPKPINKKSLVLGLLIFMFLVCAGYIGFLKYKINTISNSIQPTPTTVPNPTAQFQIDYPKTSYKTIQLADEVVFFTEQFKNRATQYLIDSNLIKSGDIQKISCIGPYTSNYRGFENDSLYIQQTQNFDEALANKETYRLKDSALLNFVSIQNNQLRQTNPDQRIANVSKCTTQDSKTLIAYTLYKADTKKNAETALWLGYMSGDNALTNIIAVPKQDGLFGCNTQPFAITSGQTGFIGCGETDAGTSIISINKIDFTKQTSEELLNCVSHQELAASPPPPTYECRIPIYQTSATDTTNWKTYSNKALTFTYPTTLKSEGQNNLLGYSPMINIYASDGSNANLMNECMQQTSVENRNNLVVRNFAQITTGEMCSGGNPTRREIWIVKTENSYEPGIMISFSATQSAQITPVIDHILSTFRFTN